MVRLHRALDQGDRLDQGQGEDPDLQIDPAPRPWVPVGLPGPGAARVGQLLPDAVAKAVFAGIDSYAWERITAWLRKKHRIGWPDLRRRFCLPGSWRLAIDGKRFTGAASVPVTRYRYRGYRISTPGTPTATTS